MAAKNTYKSNSLRKADKRARGFSFSFLKDRRFILSIGFVLIALSIFMLTSFLSFLLSGNSDQSVVEAFFSTGLRDSGLEAKNWLGVLGAITAYYFIFKWFGIASIFLPPLIFNLGYKMVTRNELVSTYGMFIFSFFAVFWFSLLFGYATLDAEDLSVSSLLSGGLGFQLAFLFHSLIGWGTYLFLLISLVVFVIYFFNVTELITFGNPKMENEPSGELEDPDPYVGDALAREEEIVTDILLKPEPEKEVIPQEFVLGPKTAEIINGQAETKENTETAGKKNDDPEFIVEELSDQEVASDQLEIYDPTLDLSSYKFPPLDLLKEYEIRSGQVTKEELEQNKDKIVETLINFKIGISNIKATIGPTVTLYEIVPDAGVKISKIKNLEDDIALSLSALGIRIIAPIPGKGTIGIEVPNKNKQLVSIRSVLGTEKFMKSEFDLPIVLGRTISNEVYLADLTRMPHLLIAGATGQGKSVGINVILASLLYKKHPSQLKFVMVDPKKVELTLFNKIERHFLAILPGSEEAIVTDTRKVVYTLNSLGIEMENRYNLLKEAQCRNLKEYNQKFISRRLNPNKGHRYLPYIVLVIDELADLMMVSGKEVETPIARLAQLARAIGIHLVIATQRPDVKVITGTIKVNFPARIAYKVVSKLDSRIILDTGGADQLIGMGDMLLSLNSDIIRLQTPYIETEEVDKICDYIGSQRAYPSAYQLPEFEGDEADIGEVNLSERDPQFDEAARLIVRHQQGSTSLIQRKLKLGYNRAGRLIDQLEAAGVVGPFEGSKAREVLIKDEYALEQFLRQLNDNTNHANTQD
ncbi:MAG TPA: DNA translocase FtsK [Cyclobacteriaceae bacterium]|nr:DNA translocase FtsK [Cyclobacteriaceae bacterium]